MVDEALGSTVPVGSVRPGRNRLADEDRAMLEERRRRHGGGEAHQEGQGKDSSGDAHSHHEAFQDDISVFGIPNEEMTPAVRKAITLLLEQINDLRAELISAHGHEAYLEEQAEKDRLLHVMRRRAFLARLSLAARRVEEEHVQFCVLYIAIENAVAVQKESGHGALESMMVHSADVLRDRLLAGDVVGSLEHFDFGIIMPGTAPVEAARKGHDLVGDMAAKSFIWQGQAISIQARFGLTEIAPGDSCDEIIERAKRIMTKE